MSNKAKYVTEIRTVVVLKCRSERQRTEGVKMANLLAFNWNLDWFPFISVAFLFFELERNIKMICRCTTH